MENDMKYRLRLNEDPEFETEVNHYEETDDNQIDVTDIGTFGIPKKGIVIEKVELIGEDGEVYAMRKFPPHLTITFTTSMEMAIQFKLTIARALIP
jgi:hypothetical protein